MNAQHSPESADPHPFALVLDESPLHGHIFGTLSVRTDAGWTPVERRCRLCNRLPVELLTVSGEAIECAGLLHTRPAEEADRG